MNPRLFDSHAHYFDPAFATLPGGADAVIEDVLSSSVCGILNAATDLSSAAACIALAERYEFCYAAVGIHPQDCGKIPVEETERVFAALETYLSHPKVVAVGEIGLDYYWEENAAPAIQKLWFEKQLQMAEKWDLPVIIHDREAHGDTLEILLSHPRVRGVLHSYSGSAETAAELLKRGWYFSFSGVITFKNATRIAEVVKSIPPQRMLTETDCPYLSPVPKRGKINRSDYMEFTAQRQAQLLDMDYESFAAQTLKNAAQLFSLPYLAKIAEESV